MVKRNIDKIIALKHFNLVLGLILFFIAYYEYTKADFGFWFWSNIIIGVINMFVWIDRIIREEEPKNVD